MAAGAATLRPEEARFLILMLPAQGINQSMHIRSSSCSIKSSSDDGARRKSVESKGDKQTTTTTTKKEEETATTRRKTKEKAKRREDWKENCRGSERRQKEGQGKDGVLVLPVLPRFIFDEYLAGGRQRMWTRNWLRTAGGLGVAGLRFHLFCTTPGPCNRLDLPLLPIQE